MRGTISADNNLSGEIRVGNVVNALAADDMTAIVTDTGDALAEIDEVLELTAQLSGTAGFSAALSVPDTIIPSNYGLITWDGAVLTVS